MHIVLEHSAAILSELKVEVSMDGYNWVRILKEDKALPCIIG